MSIDCDVCRGASAQTVSVCAALCLTACAASYTTLDGRAIRVGSEEFREHAQAVFRKHNQIANELIYELAELEDTQPHRHARLMDAEAAMLQACKPMNDLAIMYRDGAKPGLLQKARLPKAIAACETSTMIAAGLLGQ